jgi:hypothetical protein
MLVDLRPKGVKGNATEKALGRAHITCNKNGIPFDTEKPMITSGVRLGSPAGTTRGFGEAEFRQIGDWIVEVVDGLAANGEDGNGAVEAKVLYVLQHDCGHGSLYSSKRANDLAGHGLSVFTLTPYRVMQFNHNEHHSHLGNLEERDTTEIFTMTLREWEEAGFWERLRYRLYRNPLLMIPVGGLLTYVFVYRWPKNAGRIDAAG